MLQQFPNTVVLNPFRLPLMSRTPRALRPIGENNLTQHRMPLSLLTSRERRGIVLGHFVRIRAVADSEVRLAHPLIVGRSTALAHQVARDVNEL